MNLALLEDPRLYSTELGGIIDRWAVGRRFPGFFFVLEGPASIAKWHFIASWALAMVTVWVIALAIFAIGSSLYRGRLPFSRIHKSD